MSNTRPPRVLAIVHTFAPAAAVGVLRPLRILDQIAADGWDATVLSALPSTYVAGTPFDPALLAKVPASVERVRVPVIRIAPFVSRVLAPFRSKPRTGTGLHASTASGETSRRTGQERSLLQRTLTFADEVTTIPDREAGWIFPAVLRALLLVATRKPDVMYSTAPPWTAQVVALAVATLTGIRWVADFRDPWARAPWRETQPSRIRRASVTLERRVVHRADAILFATRTNRDEYASHYGPELAGKFHVVSNGCDPDEFVGVKGRPEPDRFVIVHAGSLYGARSPVPVFRAIAAAIRDGAIAQNSLRVRLIGMAVDDRFAAAAAELGLSEVVEFVPRMRRSEIISEMASASCLLVLQPGTTVSIPGKVYEYLAVGRPILAVCEEGELSDLVRRSGVGIAVGPDDPAAIEAGLRQVMALARRADLPRVDPQLYDGRRPAQQAMRIIREVAGSTARLKQGHTKRSRPRSTGDSDNSAFIRQA